MSTVKANTVTASTTNGNVSIVGNGTGKVTLGDGNLIFPDADGSASQFLQTNGSGTLSFSDVSATIAQLVSTTKTDTFSMTGNTFTDVTGLSVNITPSSASNKVFVQAMISAGSSYWYVASRLVRDSTTIAVGDAAGNRVQASTGWPTSVNDAYDDYRTVTQPIMFLDSPATTSQVTYKVQMASYTSSYPVVINRSYLDTDSTDQVRLISTITAMEVVV